MKVESQLALNHMSINVPPEIYIKIALSLSHNDLRDERDEYVFNALARAIPSLGRWTIAGPIVSRRLDLMIMFGYTAVYIRIYERLRGIEWKKNNVSHRNDGPACMWDNGDASWWKHGERHRVDGPAVMCSDGSYNWCRDGKSCRDDNLPAVFADAGTAWKQYGKLHRTDGPAQILSNGTIAWYRNDELYRADGLCVIYPSRILING